MDTIKVPGRRPVRPVIRQGAFAVLFLLSLTPLVSPPLALLLGLGVALFAGHPFQQLNHRVTNILLQVSVVGLGFGMDISSVLRTGKEGVTFTAVSIVATLAAGLVMGGVMRTDKKTSLLIAGGTAICGGSAIAALAPVIKAEERQVSVALGVVFILNSVALFLFPAIGHLLHLSQSQFGLWSAIAIHDTSSVVGAAGKYGPEALSIATTVKLARALWIIPVSLVAAGWVRREGRRGAAGVAGVAGAKIKVPYFIGLFVIVVLVHTWVPLPLLSHAIVGASHAGLTLTLFLIGSGLTRQSLKVPERSEGKVQGGARDDAPTKFGIRPMVQGVILWMLIAGGALWGVMAFAG